ncbi:putative metalloprotease CJM1_0395 family protein [Aestuariirhabdus litorea]|uniref:Catalase n=1 Tax=Aestuariirhabdus litorea TaxID=2528527 RepID=A0A3P3VKB3_9GAMM|nr:putative metalloprotease CJM1_0395 family protein [Aestuariirhabdus litorea]RRJ83171.1 catalase [Aestuariirhabdus litorea]RWW93328.1 catalase [Endozoicomonadaceae bacterium GTF-13]
MQIPPFNLAPIVTPPAPVGKQQEAQTAPEEESRVFSPVEETDALAPKSGPRESPDKAKEKALDLQQQLVASDEEGSAQEESQTTPSAPEGGQGRLAENSERERLQISELVARDREVRNHEQAHASVGGALAGAASYQYTIGPDGRRYATSGEVSIAVGRVEGDPKATIERAEQVQRAALAPANPSVQDRRVAAQAAQIKLQASRELAAEAVEERRQEQTQRAEDRAEREAAQELEEQREQERLSREEQFAAQRERQREQERLQRDRLLRTNQGLADTYSVLSQVNLLSDSKGSIDLSA